MPTVREPPVIHPPDTVRLHRPRRRFPWAVVWIIALILAVAGGLALAAVLSSGEESATPTHTWDEYPDAIIRGQWPATHTWDEYPDAIIRGQWPATHTWDEYPDAIIRSLTQK